MTYVDSIETEEHEDYLKKQVKNKQTIQDMWNFIQRKGYKKSALYHRIVNMHQTGKIKLTIGDLILISDLLEYKGLWATFKAQDLGIIEEH